MRKVFLPLIIALFGFQATAQKSEEASIKKVIQSFAKAADENKADELGALLDPNYRIVMNRMFGSKEVSVMPREMYLEKIKNKEFGGDQREVNIKQILVNGNTATARVNFKGTKMTFESFLVLVKGEDNSWKLVSDIPVIK